MTTESVAGIEKSFKLTKDFVPLLSRHPSQSNVDFVYLCDSDSDFTLGVDVEKIDFVKGINRYNDDNDRATKSHLIRSLLMFFGLAIPVSFIVAKVM